MRRGKTEKIKNFKWPRKEKFIKVKVQKCNFSPFNFNPIQKPIVSLNSPPLKTPILPPCMLKKHQEIITI